MTIRWVYLDESEFKLNGRDYIAYGALITEQKIPQNFIDNALNTLQKFKDENDEDYKNIIDGKTLARKYFHACDDGCCGHTSICREIEKLNGEITLNCIPKDDEANLDWLGMITAIQGLAHPGHTALIFENRVGLTDAKIGELYRIFDSNMLQNYARNLFMPNYFPEPWNKITGKNESGIQFIDFILWAYQRHLKGDSRWHNRVIQNSRKRGWFHSQTQYADDEAGEDLFIMFTINNGLQIMSQNEYNDRTSKGNAGYLSIVNYDEVTPQNIEKSLLLVDYVMSQVKYPNTPEEYFGSQIKYSIENRLVNLEDFLVIFLKMFDTFNFIAAASNENIKKDLFVARKIVALSFYSDYPDRLKLKEDLKYTWDRLIKCGLVK